MSDQEKYSQESMVRPYLSHMDRLSLDVSFDALIVPQGRSAEHIARAAHLARQASSTLISLCSHEAKVDEVASFLDNMPDGPKSWYAVGVPQGYSIPGVDLTAHKEIPDLAHLPEDWNISDKRNIGLAIAKIIDAERILFLDDDMAITAAALSLAGLTLYLKDISGLECKEYPDNSAFMHVKAVIESYGLSLGEYSGRGQRSRHPKQTVRTGMLSGNSLAVNPRNVDEHFPKIYNEDWLMMYKYIQNGKASVAPAESRQDSYDPFKPERARQEEFGDIVGPGLYKNLGQADKSGIGRTLSYWDQTIKERRDESFEMLEAIGAKHIKDYWPTLHSFLPPEVVAMPADEQALYRSTLEAGLEVSEQLNGNIIVDYIRAWREDQGRWAKMTEQLPRTKTIKQALSRLALDVYISNE